MVPVALPGIPVDIEQRRTHSSCGFLLKVFLQRGVIYHQNIHDGQEVVDRACVDHLNGVSWLHSCLGINLLATPPGSTKSIHLQLKKRTMKQTRCVNKQRWTDGHCKVIKAWPAHNNKLHNSESKALHNEETVEHTHFKNKKTQPFCSAVILQIFGAVLFWYLGTHGVSFSYLDVEVWHILRYSCGYTTKILGSTASANILQVTVARLWHVWHLTLFCPVHAHNWAEPQRCLS